MKESLMSVILGIAIGAAFVNAFVVPEAPAEVIPATTHVVATGEVVVEAGEYSLKLAGDRRPTFLLVAASPALRDSLERAITRGSEVRICGLATAVGFKPILVIDTIEEAGK